MSYKSQGNIGNRIGEKRQIAGVITTNIDLLIYPGST
jgi:hypothetical protein